MPLMASTFEFSSALCSFTYLSRIAGSDSFFINCITDSNLSSISRSFLRSFTMFRLNFFSASSACFLSFFFSAIITSNGDLAFTLPTETLILCSLNLYSPLLGSSFSRFAISSTQRSRVGLAVVYTELNFCAKS